MGHAKKVKGREFTFKLALALGKTIEELEHTMTQSELQEWYEYYKIDPFPQDKQELQLATLNFLISTAHGGNSTIEDFLISNQPQAQGENLEHQIKNLFGGM